MNLLSTVSLMATVCGVGVAIDSCEVLVARHALAPGGLFSWEVLSVGRRYLVAGPIAASLQMIFRYPTVLALPGLQLFCSIGLLTALAVPQPWRGSMIAVCALTVAAARMLFYMRQQLGLDGGDQMLLVVLLATGFGAALGGTIAGVAAIDYAALQLLLSYAVSGTAKAVSSTWRSGRAITGITATIGYGQPWLHKLLQRFPALARPMCWSVIAFECGALPLALLGHTGAAVIITAGLIFHVVVAVTMGLNIFVWAFAACYPALWLLTGGLPWLH